MRLIAWCLLVFSIVGIVVISIRDHYAKDKKTKRISLPNGNTNLYAGTRYPGGRIDHFRIVDGYGTVVERLDLYYDEDGVYRETKIWNGESIDLGTPYGGDKPTQAEIVEKQNASKAK